MERSAPALTPRQQPPPTASASSRIVGIAVSPRSPFLSPWHSTASMSRHSARMVSERITSGSAISQEAGSSPASSPTAPDHRWPSPTPVAPHPCRVSASRTSTRTLPVQLARMVALEKVSPRPISTPFSTLIRTRSVRHPPLPPPAQRPSPRSAMRLVPTRWVSATPAHTTSTPASAAASTSAQSG